MKRIGTFLVTTILAAGLVLGGTGAMGKVHAAANDTKDNTVYYFATPKLVVTGRDIKGDKVKAGDNFEMVLHFKNEANSTKLRNVSIKLSSDDNQIVTTSGSDTYYIKTLDKDEEFDVTVEMTVREDLAQNNYAVDVSYTYEDANKNSFDGNATVTVPVYQESRLGLSEVKLSKSELMVDGKTSLSFKVNNMGLDKLRNVKVEFGGDTIQEISYYVGNIDSGVSGAVDMTITPDKVGTDDIHIKVTYEDTTGNEKTYEETVGLTVNEAVNDALPETMQPENTKSMIPLVGGALAVIIIIIVIVAVIKKKNQKKYE